MTELNEAWEESKKKRKLIPLKDKRSYEYGFMDGKIKGLQVAKKLHDELYKK